MCYDCSPRKNGSTLEIGGIALQSAYSSPYAPKHDYVPVSIQEPDPYLTALDQLIARFQIYKVN